MASLEHLSNDGDQVQQLECKHIYEGQAFEESRMSVSEVNNANGVGSGGGKEYQSTGRMW